MISSSKFTNEPTEHAIETALMESWGAYDFARDVQALRERIGNRAGMQDFGSWQQLNRRIEDSGRIRRAGYDRSELWVVGTSPVSRTLNLIMRGLGSAIRRMSDGRENETV